MDHEELIIHLAVSQAT